MSTLSPVQAVQQVLEYEKKLLLQRGYTVEEEAGVDVDRGVYSLHVSNSFAKGQFEIDEGGSGYIEIIHEPTGRPILRQIIDEIPAFKARAAAENFTKLLFGADADTAPPDSPIQLQFYDWLRSIAKSSNLPSSPWVHSGSMSHPWTQDFIKHPPPTVTIQFTHYVSNQSILLTVTEDGYALIEKQETDRGPVILIQKSPLESSAEFPGLYKQAFDMAVICGLSSRKDL